MRLFLVALLSLAHLPAADNDAAKRLNDAKALFSDVMGDSGDQTIPQEVLDQAHCVVIIPGQLGRGFLSCRNKSGLGWSAPRAWGIEGGAHTDLIMLVMSERSAEKLLLGRFTPGVDSTGAAGPVERNITARNDAQMHAEILSWSRSQGQFAGIELQGVTLRQRANSEMAATQAEVTSAAAKLMAQLDRYSARRKGTK